MGTHTSRDNRQILRLVTLLIILQGLYFYYLVPLEICKIVMWLGVLYLMALSMIHS